eukprot:GHVT01093430.1.p1 GENE.GHVT01093430.1~~GHVT01093430.1.p1  ORF type:complete len:237 (+),score=52.15 GHVT01093430.1:3-713(+)
MEQGGGRGMEQGGGRGMEQGGGRGMEQGGGRGMEQGGGRGMEQGGGRGMEQGGGRGMEQGGGRRERVGGRRRQGGRVSDCDTHMTFLPRQRTSNEVRHQLQTNLMPPGHYGVKHPPSSSSSISSPVLTPPTSRRRISHDDDPTFPAHCSGSFSGNFLSSSSSSFRPPFSTSASSSPPLVGAFSGAALAASALRSAGLCPSPGRRTPPGGSRPRPPARQTCRGVHTPEQGVRTPKLP